VEGRWSSLDRGLRASFNQPYVFAPHFSAGLEGQLWRTVTPAYESRVAGGRTTLTHQANPRSAWSVSFGSEYTSSSVSESALNDPTLVDDLIALGLDPTTGRQEGTLNGVAFDINHSTTNNLLDARRGYQVGVHVEAAGSLLPGTFNFTAVSFDARYFLPLGDRFVVATRLQAGNINPNAADPPGNVPFSKKYLLGGSTSIRGWGRYEVSPLGGEGTPIGGNSMIAFTSELRAIVWGNLGGVLFIDGGNVWESDWSIDVNDLRYAVGAGLRYTTPVGPIRLDWGYQLNPIEDLLVDGQPQSRQWRVHFSIGQAF
jgi:outer membrane protein assembly factor BamA